MKVGSYVLALLDDMRFGTLGGVGQQANGVELMEAAAL